MSLGSGTLRPSLRRPCANTRRRPGTLWDAVGGCGRLWEAVGGCGTLGTVRDVLRLYVTLRNVLLFKETTTLACY